MITNSLTTPRAFHIMVKPRGPICNLDCAYCFYLPKRKLYPGSDFQMRKEVLAIFTRQYIESQPVSEVIFGWQGGEPTLMGLGFFQTAVELQRKYRKPGSRILNTVQTNGTLLDDAWCQFFRAHGFLIGVSLDGPSHLHDAYRVDKGGQPTFDRAMSGVELLKRHRVEHNILTAVHAANAAYPLDVYRFLRDEVGAQFIQFIPIVERDSDPGRQAGNRISKRSVTGRQYGNFLIAVFDEWVRHDVGKVFVQIFDVALGVWHGQPATLCAFAETCGQALAMEHNGDLYSCDHYVEPRRRLGNICESEMTALVNTPEQRRFGLAKRDRLPRRCRECEVRFICNGGCPKDRILKTPAGEPGLNYLCEGYLAFFRHIDQPMKLMSALLRIGKPPAEIMRVLDDKA